MDPERIFSLASLVALVGWVAMLASPWFPRLVDIISGYAVPALLSSGYAVLLVAFWGASTGGGFGSLEAVGRLFATPEVLLAGWVHYLAFDLFVGAWELRVARRERIAFLALIPCLVATFLIGPAGLLLFLILRLATGRTRFPFAPRQAA